MEYNCVSKQASNNPALKKERNATIELLRIISMAMVLVLHTLSSTGALEYLTGVNYYVYWWMEALSIGAVDIFIIISSYFIVDSKFKAKSVFRVAIGGVWLYSVVFTAVSMVISGDEWTKMSIVKMMFPFYTKKYWFVNSYVLFYILSPFLNKLINTISKKQHTALAVILFLVFCIRGTFSLMTWTQDSSGGMNILLFMPLYVIATWLNKYYVADHRPLKYIITYFVLSIILVGSKKVLMLIGIGADYATKLYGYTSFVVVIQSFAIFLAFLNMKPITGKISELINKVAKHSFSVYIIHFAMMGVLFTEILHVDRFIDNVLTGVPAVIIAVILVYICCTIIDIVKTFCTGKLTKLLLNTKLYKLYDKLMGKWEQAVN